MNDSKWSSQNTVTIDKHQFLLFFPLTVVFGCEAWLPVPWGRNWSRRYWILRRISNHFGDAREKGHLKSYFTSFVLVAIILPRTNCRILVVSLAGRLYCSSVLFYVDVEKELLRHLHGEQYAVSFRITSRTHLRTDLYNLRVAPSAKVWSLTVPPPVEPNLHRP